MNPCLTLVAEVASQQRRAGGDRSQILLRPGLAVWLGVTDFFYPDWTGFGRYVEYVVLWPLWVTELAAHTNWLFINLVLFTLLVGAAIGAPVGAVVSRWIDS